jgi:hypothetical protein
MGKRTWMDVGITVLGLFLVCSAAVGVAQNPGTELDSSQGTAMTGRGMAMTGQTGDSQQAANAEVQQWQEIAQLRTEVSRLQQELARMQARLSPGGETPSQGTGGGGTAGTGDSNAAQVARPDTSGEGVAVANIILTGRVRSVSPRELVLIDEGGGSNALVLASDVRVFRGREQVSLQSLREGAFVRASADLYARDNPVTEIQLLPSERTSRE